jgi:hypothetical protein
LVLGTRVRPLNGDEAICELILKYPLHVLALLYFGVVGGLTAVLSVGT